MTIENIANNLCFDGEQKRFSHHSETLDCQMHFSVFLPPSVLTEKVKAPVLYWLSGLTCTDENFVQKAAAQKYAADLGIIIVAPDTSPRGDDIPDDPEGAWDFGLGAGFYVNATETPWKKNYRMFDYVTEELPHLIKQNFPTNGKNAISGHSMGGHGALICALKKHGLYQSASAFAPICHPSECPWGKKAFSNYLGKDTSQWKQWDTCELIRENDCQIPLLIDQGGADNFLEEQLRLDDLIKLSATYPGHMQINTHTGYDHSYFFITTFIEKHLNFHAQYLFN